MILGQAVIIPIAVNFTGSEEEFSEVNCCCHLSQERVGIYNHFACIGDFTYLSYWVAKLINIYIISNEVFNYYIKGLNSNKHLYINHIERL